MKKLLFILIVFLSAFERIAAQKEIWAKASLDIVSKPYYQFDHGFSLKDTMSSLVSQDYSSRQIDYWLSFFIRKPEQKSFWETGLRYQRNANDVFYFEKPFDIASQKTIGRAIATNHAISVSWNRIVAQKNGEKGAWQYSFGWAVELSAQGEKFTASDARFYSEERLYGGCRFAIVPRIQRRIGKRMLIEMAPHLSLADFGVAYRDFNDPTLSEAQQTSTTFDAEIWRSMGFRFGLGWRFNKLKETAAPPAKN